MKNIIILLLLGILWIAFPSISFSKEQPKKPRIIVTADPELDDNNSLIRFLLYSNELDIEGLVYASSQFHWKGDGKGTKFMVQGREYTRYGLNLCPCESYRWKKDERFIHEIVEAYEKVYVNLKKHDPAYPKPSYLKSVIRYGNIEFEGDFTKDTDGSNLIKAAILDDEPGPLFITAWGGQSTIARALKSIEDEFKSQPNWNLVYQKVSEKVVILPSGDQDGTFASYIQKNWPKIDYRQYRNGPRYGYGAQLNASKENAPLLTAEWMHANIRSKGPLGEIYRVWGDGKTMVQGDIFDYFGMAGYTSEQLKKMGYIVWMPVQTQGSWLGEGDTGTFMNILSNGLNAYEQDSPGGWGGRRFYPDLKTYVDPFSNDTSKNKDLVISEATVNRLNAGNSEVEFPNFFPAAQNDFAARMAWTVASKFNLGNHSPQVKISGERIIYAKPGEVLTLNATIKDPDGDAVSIKWWQLFQTKDENALPILNSTTTAATIQIPTDAKVNRTYFVVIEVIDSGIPALTRYQLLTIKL